MIPPEQDAEFICQMEDILDLYSQPEDPNYPLVCFDETSKQMTKEIHLPQAAEPGKLAREDYQYGRNRSCNAIKWRFTTQDARIKLRHLYPSF